MGQRLSERSWGTALRKRAGEFGLVFEPEAPHCVVRTDTMTALDIRRGEAIRDALGGIIIPVLDVVRSRGLDLRNNLFREVFKADIFGYTSKWGWNNVSANMFFIYKVLKDYLLAQSPPDSRDNLAEALDFVYLLQPNITSDTDDELLDIPIRFREHEEVPAEIEGASPGPLMFLTACFDEAKVFRFSSLSDNLAGLRAFREKLPQYERAGIPAIDHYCISSPEKDANAGLLFLWRQQKFGLSEGAYNLLKNTPARLIPGQRFLNAGEMLGGTLTALGLVKA